MGTDLQKVFWVAPAHVIHPPLRNFKVYSDKNGKQIWAEVHLQMWPAADIMDVQLLFHFSPVCWVYAQEVAGCKCNQLVASVMNHRAVPGQNSFITWTVVDLVDAEHKT